MKKRLTAAILCITLILSSAIFTVFAEDDGTVPDVASSQSTEPAEDVNTVSADFEVEFGQSEAREIFAMINDFRTGDDAWYWNDENSAKVSVSDLSALTYDYSLEKIAMQRAAEIAISCGHDRPDGTQCFTAYTEYGYSFTSAGENIAAGQSSAAKAFSAWLEKSSDYSGQGHRRNMLNSAYTAVGIGHVRYKGVDYWVQEFANPNASPDTTETTAQDGTLTVSINLLKSNVTSSHVEVDGDQVLINMMTGEPVSLPMVNVSLTMKETWPAGQSALLTINPEWKVEEPDIVTITEDKMLSAIKPGSTSLTAYVLDQTVTAPVTALYFSDVLEDNSFFNEINWAAAEKITAGFSDGTFRPWNNCTRIAFIVFLWRLAGSPTSDSEGNSYGDAKEYFLDVSNLSDEFRQALAWGYIEGVTTGWGSGNFKPHSSITRHAAMTMLWRYFGRPNPGKDNMTFVDVKGKIPSGTDYYNAILWSLNYGISTGYKDGTFRPYTNMSRAAMITFIYRIMSKF